MHVNDLLYQYFFKKDETALNPCIDILLDQIPEFDPVEFRKEVNIFKESEETRLDNFLQKEKYFNTYQPNCFMINRKDPFVVYPYHMEFLRNKVFTKVEQKEGHEKSDLIVFTPQDYEGFSYVFLHNQDCCEHVYVEDICGDLKDLVGKPLLVSEEVYNHPDMEKPRQEEDKDYGTFTWTFYKFATVKGYVTIRWYGSSNGYYSESVNLELQWDEKS